MAVQKQNSSGTSWNGRGVSYCVKYPVCLCAFSICPEYYCWPHSYYFVISLIDWSYMHLKRFELMET